MSLPISARMVFAAKSLTPGIVHKRLIKGSKGGLTGRHLRVHLGNRHIDLVIDFNNRFLQGVVLPQMEPQDEPMVIGQPSMQRIVQLLAGRLDPSVGELCQFPWISDAADHRRDHPPQRIARSSSFAAPALRTALLVFKTGDQISPPGGYVGGGLQMQTDLAIDPAGNVWVMNNWQDIDSCFGVPDEVLSTRCGGQGVTVFYGMAKPVRAPQIGPARPADQ